MITIGIDPDSSAHGVAIFDDDQLISLESLPLMELLEEIKTAHLTQEGCIVAIEDVMRNQFIYQRNSQASKASQSKVAMHVGRCQQSQVELVRALEYHGIALQLFKPDKSNWAKNKAQFEKVTKWTRRSNVDTRSAAFFGFLAIEQARRKEPRRIGP